MNLIARSIMMACALTILVSTTGCDILNPKPDTIWHDGKVINTGDRTLYCRFTNPDSEYNEYKNEQLLEARTGSATYWLHERSRTNPYMLEVLNSDRVLVRTIKISPDADANDHGDWNWTVNAATGAVQLSMKHTDGSTLVRHYDANGNHLKTVLVN